MGFLSTWLEEILKDFLISGIVANMDNLFGNVNSQVGNIATQVGTTPSVWNGAVFSLIKDLAETVVLPIAGLILAFVMTWELIHLIIERNNLHEIDYWIFFKWIFKTLIAVLILSNTFFIVMGIFDVAQHVVSNAGNLISGNTAVNAFSLASFEARLKDMSVGPLIGLWLQSFVVQTTLLFVSVIIFVIVYGRMLEIFLLTSLAPLPMATLTSREMGGMGQNYLKALLAVAFQGLLIMVCVAIYAVLVQGIAIGNNPMGAVWTCLGYTVLLCFALFKTGSISKSIFGAR